MLQKTAGWLGLLLSLPMLASAQNWNDSGPPAGMKGERAPRSGERPVPLDRMAMHRLLAAEFARRSGRASPEIFALLESRPPPEVAEELGLDRETARAAMVAARSTLIQRMQDAQLITPEDAQKARAAPLPHAGSR
jgi:hypothetical protein